MKDRIPKHPGRVELKPVAGQEHTYDMTMADDAIEDGTPPIKRHLLPDDVAKRIGGNSPPYDIGEALDKMNSFLPTETIDDVPIEELQTVIDSLPKLLNRNITINVLPGTYDGALTIARFFGGGTLRINGATTATTTHTVTRINIDFCKNALVTIFGFNCIADSDSAIYIRESTASIAQCNIAGGANTTALNRGVFASRAVVSVSLCTISNKQVAVLGQSSSQIDVHTLAGANNYIIYQSYANATIGIRSQGTITGLRYCSEGNNSRVRLGASVTFATTMANLQNAINGIPMDIGLFNFTINVSAGTSTEVVSLARRQGTGLITIHGASSMASTHNISRIALIEIQSTIEIRGFNFQEGNVTNCTVFRCTNVHIVHSRFVAGNRTTVTNVAIACEQSPNVIVAHSEISNKARAINSFVNSNCHSTANIGSNNTEVFGAHAGIITRASTQPTGITTAVTSGGGQVL